MQRSAIFNPATSVIATTMISLMVLLGWILNLPLLQTVLPGLISMKANTAFCFLCAALGLWLLRSRDLAEQNRRWARVPIGLMIAIAGLTLAEYGLGVDLGIDELLFRDTVSPLYPGRMAPQSAVCFILFGVALAVSDGHTVGGRRPSEILALIVGAVALLAIVGYLYNVQYLYAAVFVAMALHTAINFLLLAIGLLLARPDAGIMRSLSGPHTGSFMARRLLPAAFLVPLLLGFLVMWGTRVWHHDASFWVSIHITGCILIDVFIVWWNAATLERIDGERQQLVRDLRDALAIRDEFLSIASHELRTPLTGAQLQVALIDRRLEREPLGPWIIPKVHTLGRQIGRLTRLVEELLDYSRITSGRMDPDIRTVDVSAVVADALDLQRPHMAMSGCELDVDLAPGVQALCDASHLEQVVTNLLDNAVKFGKGRPVHVRLQQDADGIRLTVRDHGIGIAPEQQRLLFGRFERLVSSRHYGGLGLGLWISRNLIERQGGRISVESATGHGATFTVRLPALVAEGSSAPDSPVAVDHPIEG